MQTYPELSNQSNTSDYILLLKYYYSAAAKTSSNPRIILTERLTGSKKITQTTLFKIMYIVSHVGYKYSIITETTLPQNSSVSDFGLTLSQLYL